MRCAISSWVMAERKRCSSDSWLGWGAHDNSSLASFPEEERASTRS